MQKRIIIFTLVLLIIVIVLAVMPQVGYTTGGYSPEELEKLVMEAAKEKNLIRLANIKYNPLFWWPFLKTSYNKLVTGQTIKAFLLCLPYWVLLSIIGALIIEGIYQLTKLIKEKFFTRRIHGQEK